MNRDYMLELYETQLEDLEKSYISLNTQIESEHDDLIRNKLKRQIKTINQQINSLQQQIKNRQIQVEERSGQSATYSLITLLESYDNEWSTILQAYHRTLANWPVKVDTEVKTVDSIIIELERIVSGTSLYTAQDEFIAHLVHDTNELDLAEALKQWAKQNFNNANWLQIYKEIESEKSQRLENNQPAILITVDRSDEASTQSTLDENYYQLDAWLIEDVETYKVQSIGYHALTTIDSPDTQPCLLDELLRKMPKLLNQFLEETNRLCENRIKYPEIHVFLPLELMHLSVDKWSLAVSNKRQIEHIGHNHIVIVRCKDRYERTYTKRSRWLKFWKRYQQVLKKPAQQVFVTGHDDDLDELMDILDNALSKDIDVVGLQVTHAPIDTQELCYELLESGLPIALWSRQNLEHAIPQQELSVLLNTCCLERLPYEVKNKRHETCKLPNKPENHIGHHLSLLWDDPYLIPPKSS